MPRIIEVTFKFDALKMKLGAMDHLDKTIQGDMIELADSLNTVRPFSLMRQDPKYHYFFTFTPTGLFSGAISVEPPQNALRFWAIEEGRRELTFVPYKKIPIAGRGIKTIKVLRPTIGRHVTMPFVMEQIGMLTAKWAEMFEQGLRKGVTK